MKPTTYEERLSALSEILPERFIELVKGHFLAVLNNYQINDVYKKAYPELDNEGVIHRCFKHDKANEHLNEVEDHLWHRATTELHNWLYDAFVETEEASKYIPNEEF